MRSGPEGSLRSTARARGEGLWEPTTAEAAFSWIQTWTPNCPRREAVWKTWYGDTTVTLARLHLASWIVAKEMRAR
eukprot:4491867-Prorocentrum_lima.AAC.1